MDTFKQKVNETAAFIKNKIQVLPQTCILTGTGLGEIVNSVEPDAIFDYENIPNFPLATVESHPGKLVFGKLNRQNIAVLKGRFHLYEGYTPLEITLPIRVMKALGVKNLIITNASGGLNLSFNEGDIMVIRDHINLTGANPLSGPNENSWGKRFPDMIHAYDKTLQTYAESTGEKLGVSLQSGVYAGLAGPSLETPAEMKFLKTVGADTVGFSTIQEVIAGVHAGMKILGLSIITNINDPSAPEPATVEGVIQVAKKAAPKLDKIIFAMMEKL